jgi:hypothetical protein
MHTLFSSAGFHLKPFNETYIPPNPKTANSPIFCLLGNINLPTTGIGSIQIAQSKKIPTTLVEKKWSSALPHYPGTRRSQ